jgi:hypothetical protein
MVSITRRDLLKTGAAAAAVGVLPVDYAQAAGDEKRGFYLSVTRTAFENTFGDDFKDVKNDADLKALIEGKADAYRENFLNAATEYSKALDPDRANNLHDQLSHRAMKQGGGLHSVLGSDLRQYTHNGRDPDLGATNPLFAKIRELHANGVITDAGYRDALKAAENLTHEPGDGWRSFNNNLIEATAPATIRAGLETDAKVETAAAPNLNRRALFGLGGGPTGVT